jgi:hypothetical protein
MNAKKSADSMGLFSKHSQLMKSSKRIDSMVATFVLLFLAVFTGLIVYISA